ncbi:MAG: hypothetical protein R2856_22520 [Caldilineaceae bacterium]
MSIGTQHPPEWKTTTDPQTGRTLRQFTSAAANSYPLYYFVDTITPDGKMLIFHSERSGWVQLYKMDLDTGAMTQLTDGRTRCWVGDLVRTPPARHLQPPVRA